MPDDIEHFVEVAAASWFLRSASDGKGWWMTEAYTQRGQIDWNRLAFWVGKGRVPEDSLSEAVTPYADFHEMYSFWRDDPRFRGTKLQGVGQKTVVSWEESMIAAIGEFKPEVVICEKEG